MRMGNPTDSQLVFECWRELGKGPVGHHVGRRKPGRHPAEMDWRLELVEASKATRGSPPEPEEQPTLRYTVELDFFVTSEVDLDNLTKSVLDTLFLPGLDDNPTLDPWRDVTGKVFTASGPQ